ncbi:MAG: CBS domain-containing protein [Candidatus Pacearchaeota archaeon]
MDTGIKVGDIMTRNFIYVSEDTNLYDCAKIMVRKRVGSLMVKDEDSLKGILTEKDIIWAVVKKTKKCLKDILVKDIMKRKVITIKPSADITEAMDRFKKKKIRRLPVVEQGKLIGLITEKDVLKIDPGLFQMIAETIKIREETEKLKRKGMSSKRVEGICEECGEYAILLKDDGQMICEDCYNGR